MCFLFNTRLEMTQQDQAIRSLEKQMKDDDEIIRLRTNISEIGGSQSGERYFDGD